MLFILIGAIGSMVVSGIIGLFVGAVILALGYKLFMAWLYPEKIAEMAGGNLPMSKHYDSTFQELVNVNIIIVFELGNRY